MEYKISIKGASNQFTLEKLSVGKEKNYQREYITAELLSSGNIAILIKDGSDNGRPFTFTTWSGIPYTDFVDGENANATFANAQAVVEWFYTNTGFKTASGGSGASAFSELTGNIADNQVTESAVVQHKDALGISYKVDDYTALSAITGMSNGDVAVVTDIDKGGEFVYVGSKKSTQLLHNGSFEAGNDSWIVSGTDANHVATFSNGKLRYQSTTTSPQLLVSQSILTVGKSYEIQIATSSYTSGSLKTDAFGNSAIISNSVGTVTISGIATAVGVTITRNSSNVDITIESILVRELISNDSGNVVNGWARIADVANIKNFNAKGDGITDDYAAIMAAHDALPKNGGTIIIPNGKFLFKTPIVFTKKVILKGYGVGEDEKLSSSVLLKSSSISGNGIELLGNSSIVDGVAVAGEEGNIGDGLVVKSGRIKITDSAFFNMGNDGLRIGTDSGNENCNLWFIQNVKTKRNGNNGLTISEGSGGGADANGGTLNHLDTQNNTGHGIYIGNAQLNSFTGIVSQTNGGDGMHLSTDANYNSFFGGDYEGNTSNDINIITGATNNKIFGGVLGSGEKISDLGTETLIIGLSLSTYSGLPE